MARKKKEEKAAAGAPAWMATFSDLMNLLLCFFVLLYSMSTIDESKYDAIRASLSAKIGIFQGNKWILNEKGMIGSGISQIKDLEEYVEHVVNEGDFEYTISQDAFYEVMDSKKDVVSDMYDEISEMFENMNITSDKVDMSVDPQYNYLKLTVNGSILFNSGSAELKTEALPVLSKVGDVLKVYDKYMIEIEGHTDNVQVTSNMEFESNMWLSSARALNATTYLVEEKGLNPSTVKSSGRGEYEPVASNDSHEGRQMNRRVEIKIYHQLSSY